MYLREREKVVHFPPWAELKYVLNVFLNLGNSSDVSEGSWFIAVSYHKATGFASTWDNLFFPKNAQFSFSLVLHQSLKFCLMWTSAKIKHGSTGLLQAACSQASLGVSNLCLFWTLELPRFASSRVTYPENNVFRLEKKKHLQHQNSFCKWSPPKAICKSKERRARKC